MNKPRRTALAAFDSYRVSARTLLRTVRTQAGRNHEQLRARFLSDSFSDRPYQFREMCPDSETSHFGFPERARPTTPLPSGPLSLLRTAAASFTANLLARERVRVFQN